MFPNYSWNQPGNRASTNAHAAASAIAVALKNSNGSAVNMKLPPTQVRSSSLQKHSNTFATSMRSNSLRQPSHSRSSSLTYSNFSTPPRRAASGHQLRHSLTPQSLNQLNELNELRSIESDFSSAYGNDSFERLDLPSQPNVRHKVSFSEVSSEFSYLGNQPRSSGFPTRMKTIKKYVPSANGLVTVEVQVPDNGTNNVSRQNSLTINSRNSSLRNNVNRSRPVSRSSSMNGLSTKRAQPIKQQIQYSNTIPEEEPLGSIEDMKEKLQKERELLQKQYYAKLEEERLYQEKIEKQKLELEFAEQERLKKEHDEEVERQRLELEALSREAEALARYEEQERLREEAEQREIEEAEEKARREAEVAAAEAEAEAEAYGASDDALDLPSVVPVDSLVSEETQVSQDTSPQNTLEEHVFRIQKDKEEEATETSELDVVNQYKSTDSFSAPEPSNNTTSGPASADFSETYANGSTNTTIENEDANDSGNHMSMAKQLRSTMQLQPLVVVTEETDSIPPRSERRERGLSNSMGSPLVRKKSALKNSPRYENGTNGGAKAPQSAASQVYLSLTTAENTRLNALNTQSSLSLSQPSLSKRISQVPALALQTKHTVAQKPKQTVTKSTGPRQQPYQQQQQQQPNNLSKTSPSKPVKPSFRGSPSTPKNRTPNTKRAHESGYNRPRPITINLPQQVSPGKFVLPKSEAKKKADALFKKANSRPRQDEEQLRQNLPPLQRKSSFEKSNDSPEVNGRPSRLSLRPDPSQYANEDALNQYLQPNPYLNGNGLSNGQTPVRSPLSRGGFKSRFADSDSDEEFALPVKHAQVNHSSRQRSGQSQQAPQLAEKGGELKKKKFGKLKKLFGSKS